MPKAPTPPWDQVVPSSGKLVGADGVEVDFVALLQSIAAGVGGTGDIDAIRVLAAAQLVQLEQIRATNTTINTSNAAIQAATEILDNIVGVIDSAHGTGIAVIGGKAESTVPTEVADGDAVALNVDTLGRLVQLATDLAQNALSVSDIAPAQMQKAAWVDWATLTSPDDETPEAVILDYENLTVQYIIARIDTSVDLIVWGSIDGGTTWFQMWADTIDSTEQQIDTVTFSGIAVERIKCEFDGEDGGTAAEVTFKVVAGN